ncbi:MAG: SDR family NAD(P)-dependent oxidoreductase [Desulfobacterales bacterium]|nr:MAG: SDR family NAD(P)-dependent oxidoreductase [Desulfobacterales bacterium]
MLFEIHGCDNTESVQAALTAFTEGTEGQLDVIINNAGIIHRNPSENFLEEDWAGGMAINLKGPFFLAQAAAKVIISQTQRQNYQHQIIDCCARRQAGTGLCSQQGRH